MRPCLAATAALLLLPAASAQAKSFTLPEARVDARVARDGAVVVRESITFDYRGSFTGAFREIPLRPGERIDRVSVTDRGRRVAGSPVRFAARVAGRKLRIVWRYRAADERRTFTLRYRISGLARAYDDAVDVNLQVWGGTWKTRLGRLKATMAAPRPVTAATARVYGHPAAVRGETAFTAGAARLRALDVPPRQAVGLRLVFPLSALASTARAQVVAGAGRDRIVAAEAGEAGEATGASLLDHLARDLPLMLLLGLAPAAAVLALVWLLVARDRGVPGYDREYEHQPPSDAPPALIAPLLRRSTTPGGREFTATLFDLIRRGYVAAEAAATAPDLILSRRGGSGAPAPLESGVARIVDRALANGPIALSELSDRIGASRAKNAKTWSSWQRQVAGELARRRWYDTRAATVIRGAAAATALAALVLLGIGIAGLAAPGGLAGDAVRLALGIAAGCNALVLAAALRSRRLCRRWTPEAARVAAPRALRDQSEIFWPAYQPGGGSYCSTPIFAGISGGGFGATAGGSDGGGGSFSGAVESGGAGGGGGAW